METPPTHGRTMLEIIFIAGSFLINLAIIAGDQDKLEKPSDDKDLSKLELILENSVEDEALHAEVAAFIDDWPEPQWKDNAYVYAWGMDKDVEDVYKSGLNIAKILRKLNLNHDYQTEYDLTFMEAFKNLELPDKNYLCRMDLSGCFNKMVQNNSSFLKEYAGFNYTVDRYHAFLSFKNYSDTSYSLLIDESPFPSYRVITVGQDLQFLKWIEIFKAKKADEALLSAIKNENQLLRKRLAQADSLMSKMILAAMFSKHLEFIHGSWSLGWISATSIDEMGVLKPLTQEHLNFTKAWTNEERMSLTMVNKTFRPKNVKNLMVEMFYPDLTKKMIKTNTILNKLYFEVIKPALSYQNLSSPVFYQKLKDFDLEIYFDEVKNPAGATVNQTTEQLKDKFMSFTVRVHELNMKTQMLKLIIQSGSIDNFLLKIKQGKSEFHNYYDGSQPEITDGRLCFNRPFEYGYFTCLVVINK